jgi:hypothetical protein
LEEPEKLSIGDVESGSLDVDSQRRINGSDESVDGEAILGM